MVNVPIHRIGPVAVPEPPYSTADAAGFDLCAAIETEVSLPPGARLLIPTGIALEIPQGYEGQVRPRSGLALKHGITVLNAPGTIDADYRGEVKVLLINHGQETFTIMPLDRIAQMVINPFVKARFRWNEAPTSTARGTGGHGSTGV